MNQEITVELRFFLVSILSGAILLAVYDIFRIFRRLIKHDSFFIALEDLIFWVGAGLFIFAMMFKENDGIIRGFSIMGMAIGMVLYHFVFSDRIVNLITKLIRLLFSPFVFVYKKVKSFIDLLFRQVKRIVKFIAKRLKKRIKSVRIALDTRKQAATLRKRKRSDIKLSKKQKVSEEKQARRKSQKPEALKELPEINSRADRPAATFERVNPYTLKKAEHMSKTGK
jgi:spore cortex biosynthesis protein YabQ